MREKEEKVKTKCKRIIAFLTLSSILFILIFSLVGCHKTLDPDDYTTEEHIEMISKKVQKKYIDRENSLYDSFAVYPLYSIDETVCIYLVEFEPYGFLLIEPRKEPFSLFVHTSMYRFNDSYMLRTGRPWRKYRYGTEDCPPEPFNDFGIKRDDLNQYPSGKVRYYELSDDGEFVDYRKSPYAVANVLDKKLYVKGKSFAVKENDKYLNLVSMLLYDEADIINSEHLTFVFNGGSVFML